MPIFDITFRRPVLSASTARHLATSGPSPSSSFSSAMSATVSSITYGLTALAP